MTDIVMGNVTPLIKEIEELKRRVKELEREVRSFDRNPHRTDLGYYLYNNDDEDW